MKYYIIAGEASGDLHAGNLIREIKKLDGQADIRAWGGDKMQAQGATIVKHYRELAFMGFAEVIMNLRTILQNLKYCKEDIAQYKPDVLILVDYPGFNLRIARWAKEQGFKVIFYVSPQVWAWKEGRVKMMRQCIDVLLTILPFEKEYYRKKWNWDVEYVGHPLVEEVERFLESGKRNAESAETASRQNSPIALLPGSRKQEILKKFPVMLEVAKRFPNEQFVVAKAPGIDEAFYDSLLKVIENVTYVANKTYELLARSKAAIVTSGTATLETALFGVPQVVCYKSSNISYQIGKRLIRVKYISLVNLIMDKPVVKELIQHDMNADAISNELHKILEDDAYRNNMLREYAALKASLQQSETASAKAARAIQKLLNSKA